MNEWPLPKLVIGFAVDTVTSPLAPLNFATVFARVSVKGYAERLLIQPNRSRAREIEDDKERRSSEKGL
jgi:hypothetical protein